MSDDAMSHDPFEWPTQDTLSDDAQWRMWLIQALSRIHAVSSETARLQTVANGRVTKLEAATADLPKWELRLSWMERIVLGGCSILLTAIVVGFARMMIRG